MSRTPVGNESSVPRVRVLVFAGPREESPIHTLSLPAAATVGDLRRHIGLFGPMIFDRRFNGGVPTGDGMRLLDLQDDNKEVQLEVRQPGVRRNGGPRPRSEAGPRTSGARPDGLRLGLLILAALLIGLVVARRVRSTRRRARR
jgi:hypothetical protein